MNNQECKVRPEIVNVNSDEPVFYPFSIKTSKCSGSCNNINDPYAKMCVSDVVKNLNVKVFNLMSRTNETRHIEWHETCKYKCRLDSSVCNNKQPSNDHECRCECKELIDKVVCDRGSIWNSSNFSVNVINHVMLVNIQTMKTVSAGKNQFINQLSENIDEAKIADENECVCSYTICVVQDVIALVIRIGIGILFVLVGT